MIFPLALLEHTGCASTGMWKDHKHLAGYRIAGNFRKHPSKYDFKKIFSKTSQPTSFRKSYKQCALASYVNNKNERVTLAHEASIGIMLTLVAK